MGATESRPTAVADGEVSVKWLSRYRPLALAHVRPLLSLPDELWTSLILPMAIAGEVRWQRSGRTCPLLLVSHELQRCCLTCTANNARATAAALRLSCAFFYRKVARAEVWQAVLKLVVNEDTIEQWKHVLLVPVQCQRFSGSCLLESWYALRITQTLDSLVDARCGGLDPALVVSSYHWHRARQSAIGKWLAAKSVDERLALMMLLRPQVQVRMRAKSDSVEPVFHVGDMVTFELAVSPAYDVPIDLLNGRIGRRCGPQPEDDYLCDGATMVSWRATTMNVSLTATPQRVICQFQMLTIFAH